MFAFGTISRYYANGVFSSVSQFPSCTNNLFRAFDVDLAGMMASNAGLCCHKKKYHYFWDKSKLYCDSPSIDQLYSCKLLYIPHTCYLEGTQIFGGESNETPCKVITRRGIFPQYESGWSDTEMKIYNNISFAHRASMNSWLFRKSTQFLKTEDPTVSLTDMRYTYREKTFFVRWMIERKS